MITATLFLEDHVDGNGCTEHEHLGRQVVCEVWGSFNEERILQHW